MRRFRARDGLEGVEFSDGLVIVNHPSAPMRYLSAVNAEKYHGHLDWLDAPAPTWSPLTIASVVLPEIIGDDAAQFVRLLTWVTGLSSPVWTPPFVVGMCRLARPHLEAQFPWLREVQRRWTFYEDPREAGVSHRYTVEWLLRVHPGPWPVEQMTRTEVLRRMTAMKVAAARPWPTVLPIGPMHFV